MIHEGFSKNCSILKAYARDAPEKPGVYLWRNNENRIIYVGKARNLRNRLGSYFLGSKDVKTKALISHSKSIETIIVSNEYEALLLENTLIKQHNPKYNINLKDGKTYPVLCISAGLFPRIFRTRHIVKDGSSYFGPFPNVQALDKTLLLIEKLFPLRKCKTLKKRDAPCLYYHLKRCLAPCCGKIEESAYKTQVERVRKLLAGETSALIADLTVQMHESARELKFEEAAGFRNAIRAVESLMESNSVADMDPEERDYIAWAAEGLYTTFSVFSMRGGRMTGRELYNSRSAAREDESLESFIVAYYSPDRPPPPRIYLAKLLPNLSRKDAEAPGVDTQLANHRSSSASLRTLREEFEVLNHFFTGRFGFFPELISPAGDDSSQTGKRHLAALAMAQQNAQEELNRRLRERGAGPALDELKQVLGLETRPERIEGFDIAQLEGRHPVASLVSFKNGIPDRKNYRYFKLKTVIGIVDDYASIHEAVYRRYSRLIKESQELPDLILIDGGIGQVNTAKSVMDELGINCHIAGLAKRDEEIWLPHAAEPIKLSRRSEALKVLQFVRDETHRFATTLNQKLRSKDLYFPVLESIEGIGPKRAAAIMKTYGSLEKVAAADPVDMAAKCDISKAVSVTVAAAARHALKEQAAKKKQLAAKKATGSTAAALAEAALAGEAFADELAAAEDESEYTAH